MAALPLRASPEPGIGQDRTDLEGRLVGRGDEHHVAPHHVADRPGQERVVGAAQEQGVHARGPDGGEQTLRQDVDLIALGLAPLDELDEAGASTAGELHRRPLRPPRPLVRTRRDGPDRAYDAHSPVPGDEDGRAHAWVDHSDQGDVELEPEQIQGGGRRGVARDHDHLHAMFADEVGGDLTGELAHLVQGPGTVRVPAGVAYVDDVLPRDQVEDGPGHCQPAEAAVEDPDRAVVHPQEATVPGPTAAGSERDQGGIRSR